MLVNYPLLYLHGWRPDPILALRGWNLRHNHKIRFIGAALGVSFFVFALVNSVIFVIERGRMPLMTRINGQNVGLKRESVVRQKLHFNFEQQAITLGLPGESRALNAKESGILLQIDQTINMARATTGWRRLPVINLFSNFNSSITPVYSVNQQQLSSVLASVITAEQKNPTDARLVVPIENAEEIFVSPAQNGYVLSAKVAADQVTNSVTVNSEFVVEVNKEVLYPNIKTVDLQQNIPKAKELAKAKINLKTQNKQTYLPDNVIRSLMTVRAENNKPKISLDRPKLIEQLKAISGTFYVAPVATTITLLDGDVSSTTAGVAGQTLDTEKTADAIIVAFESEAFEVNANLSDITSPKVYKRTYSNSNQGLYKLIEDFAKSHGGSYKVAVVELKDGVGPTRSAFYAADDQIITASTFKVFVAYVALLKIEQGLYTLQTPTSQGTIDHCIHQMLIPSDDDCALALQHLIGWSEIDRVLAAAGFTSTDLNNSTGGDKVSTARDEMLLLTKLYNGELLNKSSVDYLFSIMDDQVYRSGIIAGSRGAQTPSKVGILYGLRHDIGIVYSLRATYALVVLTNNAGGNFTNIKLLSEQIYDFYNR
ncbi:MAG: serine hydrolase [Patescibacteria group bacterium]